MVGKGSVFLVPNCGQFAPPHSIHEQGRVASSLVLDGPVAKAHLSWVVFSSPTARVSSNKSLQRTEEKSQEKGGRILCFQAHHHTRVSFFVENMRGINSLLNGCDSALGRDDIRLRCTKGLLTGYALFRWRILATLRCFTRLQTIITQLSHFYKPLGLLDC